MPAQSLCRTRSDTGIQFGGTWIPAVAGMTRASCRSGGAVVRPPTAAIPRERRTFSSAEGFSSATGRAPYWQLFWGKRKPQCRVLESSSSPLKTSSKAGSPGILCPSEAHSPRSISLQRSLQNGRNGNLSFHSMGFLQVGQFRVGVSLAIKRFNYFLRNYSLLSRLRGRGWGRGPVGRELISLLPVAGTSGAAIPPVPPGSPGRRHCPTHRPPWPAARTGTAAPP